LATGRLVAVFRTAGFALAGRLGAGCFSFSGFALAIFSGFSGIKPFTRLAGIQEPSAPWRTLCSAESWPFFAKAFICWGDSGPSVFPDILQNHSAAINRLQRIRFVRFLFPAPGNH